MHHSEKTQRPAESKSSSKPLKIDSSDSAHEKNAEAVAERMARNGQLMGSDSMPNGQVAGNPNPNNGMIAPAGVEEQINSRKGGGDKLPETVKRMMKGKSEELDDVRIHTDSNAAELAKAVNAKAFTVGKNIFFGQGKFDTNSPEGKELIGHELSHAVANRENGTPIIQRDKVDTHWGTYETETYELLEMEVQTAPKKSEMKAYGAGIRLFFTPGKNVDATKIAMAQTAKGVMDNKSDPHLDPTSKAHSIKEQESVADPKLQSFKFKDDQKVDDSGFHIDQYSNNPLYSGKKLQKDKGLADSRRSWGTGQFGHHYKKGEYEFTKPAGLFDKPQFLDLWYEDADKNIPGPNSGQLFETTALAVNGAQTGTYYGSVQWGWFNDDNGKGSLVPLKVLSSGATSSTFMKSAEIWNDGKTARKGETVDLPLYDFYVVKANTMLKPDSDDLTTVPEINIEAGSRVMVPKGTVLSNAEIHVTVVDGIKVGEKGMVSPLNLQEERTDLKNNDTKN